MEEIKEIIKAMIQDSEYKLIKEEYKETKEEEGIFYKAYREIEIDLTKDFTDEEVQEALKIKSLCDLKDYDGIKWDYDINYKILKGMKTMTEKKLILHPMGVENVIIVKTKNQFNETEYRIGITNCKKSEEEDIEEIKKYGDIITKETLLNFFED